MCYHLFEISDESGQEQQMTDMNDKDSNLLEPLMDKAINNTKELTGACSLNHWI